MVSSAFTTPDDETAISDRELIESALLGDQTAYAQLAKRYQDRLFTAIRNDVGCSELAEDIVQDAFVRAFMKLESFRCESSFYTWLYRIALNSRRYYLRNRHRMVPLDSLAEQSGQTYLETQNSPPDRIERHEECRQVQAALARLDEHHRKILVLREFDGCDYRTISEHLHLTMGTVRSRLSRARAQLRKELNTYLTAAPTNEAHRVSNDDWTAQSLSLTA